MRCVTCLSVSEAEIDGNNKRKDLISCTRCRKPLYCSVSCAEIGWSGHRFSCLALPSQESGDLLLRCQSQRQRQRQRQQQSWIWFSNLLRRFCVTDETVPSSKDILYLLEATSHMDTMSTYATDENIIRRVEEVLGNLDTALGRVVGTLEVIRFVLLQARLLSIFLREHDKALGVVRRALAWLTLGQTLEDSAACRALLEEERMSVWTRKYPKVVMRAGMTPLSSQWIACGEVVARDTVPLLVWRASNFPTALSSRQSVAYDEGLRAMRDAYMHLRDTHSAVGALADGGDNLTMMMMGTTTTIPALFLLLQSGEGLPLVQHASAEVVASAATHLSALGEIPPPSWLVQLFFTAMLSRRRLGKDMLGLFDFASRLRHSCAPNCIWDYKTGEVRALRVIAPHEPLTMDVLWEPLAETACYTMLKLPTCLRQESVQASMGYLCACDRCTGGSLHIPPPYDLNFGKQEEVGELDMRGLDSMRAFPCPLCRGKEGWRYRRQHREGQRQKQQQQEKGVVPEDSNEMIVQCLLTPYEPWVCLCCGEHWRDSEMPLEKEKRLCRQAERLAVVAARGFCGRAFFGEVKVLMQDVLDVFGHQHHSTYLLACESLVYFYRYVSNRFPPPTGLLAQTYTVSWCRKWIACAQKMRLPNDCPHVYSMFIVDTALSLQSASLLLEKVVLLRHAEAQCPIVVTHGATSPKVAAVAALLYDESSPTFTRIAQLPSAFTEFINADEHLMEDTLISNWESHLLERVQLEVCSNERPRLPASLANVFQRHSPI